MHLLNPQVPALFSYDTPVIQYNSYPPIGLAAFNKVRDTLNYLDKFPSRAHLVEKITKNSPNIRGKNIWYCYFTTDHCFKIHNIVDLMGQKVYRRVLKKDAHLILDISMEPFLTAIDTIYQNVIIKHNIPSSQVVFLSNMYDAEQYNIKSAKRFGQEPMKIIYFSALEWMVQNILKTGVNLPNTLQIKPYKKKFLNLNRRWRSHRPMFVLLLYYYKLLEHGHVSLAPDKSHIDLAIANVQNINMSETWNHIWDGLKSDAATCPEMINAILKSESIKQMPPLYLDINDMSINCPGLTDSANRFYEESYFSVITETTYSYKSEKSNSRFITEKTFKAIALQHPFILLSIPRSLEVLKKIGYKTFSPWINESYDEEFDDNKRMLMVIEETRRLCNLNEDELKLFLVECKKICDFNFKLLSNQQNFLYGDF